MKEISKGKQVNIGVTFKRRGQVCTFLNPPTWIVYNEDGKQLLSGVALSEGIKWKASFSVATSYVVPDGKEELTVEFSGFDDKNHSHVKAVDVVLIDDSEEYKPIGVVYSLINAVPLRDTIQLDTPSIETLEWRILSPISETPIASDTVSGPINYTTANSKGYSYKFSVGRPAIDKVYNDPYLLVIDTTPVGGSDEDIYTEVHPLYVLNAKTSTLATQLQTYLDKAQLTEIDPTLQWHLPEYLHFTLEGIKHINGAPSEPSFWTVMDVPTMLRQCLFAASALYALNARYLAEGFNAFEFSGLNSNMNINRNEAISYKIEELKGYLETNLVPAKKAAISANGPGTPVGSEIDNRRLRVGSLGLQAGPMSNRLSRNRYRRFS